MSLLTTIEAKRQIAEQVSLVTQNLKIISAFCKIPAIEFIDGNITKELLSKKLMVRFSLQDILSGASDLKLYEYCRSNGWDLYINFDLHAKTYVFDNIRGIIGSGNATSRGFGLSEVYNYEFASLTELSDDDMQKIDNLYSNSIKVNDELYDMLVAGYNKAVAKSNDGITNPTDLQWDNTVMSLYHPDITTLFTYNLPQTTYQPDLKDDDLAFIEVTLPSNNLKQRFTNSVSYRWLKKQLVTSENHALYYGELTQLLHNAIINDPKPYRKEVKELLSNLLSWIKGLEVSEITIDRPNHSERIKLNFI